MFDEPDSVRIAFTTIEIEKARSSRGPSAQENLVLGRFRDLNIDPMWYRETDKRIVYPSFTRVVNLYRAKKRAG